MSLKLRSLGTISSAARGQLITSGTNATPIVATVTALHRMKNGERFGIVGVTTLTAMNGDWEFGSVGATAATLLGSAGNGAFAGTAVVAALMDRSPHLAKRSAVLLTGDVGLAAIFIGTLLFEVADQRKSDNSTFQYTNTSGVATDGFKDGLLSGEIAIPAQTVVGGGSIGVEVNLERYCTLRCSAYTSGSAVGALLAC
jgi:hypothetical protein